MRVRRKKAKHKPKHVTVGEEVAKRKMQGVVQNEVEKWEGKLAMAFREAQRRKVSKQRGKSFRDSRKQNAAGDPESTRAGTATLEKRVSFTVDEAGETDEGETFLVDFEHFKVAFNEEKEEVETIVMEAALGHRGWHGDGKGEDRAQEERAIIADEEASAKRLQLEKKAAISACLCAVTSICEDNEVANKIRAAAAKAGEAALEESAVAWKTVHDAVYKEAVSAPYQRQVFLCIIPRLCMPLLCINAYLLVIFFCMFPHLF